MDIHIGIHGATIAIGAMVTADTTAVTTEVIMEVIMVTIVGIHLMAIMEAIPITEITTILITPITQQIITKANAVRADPTPHMLVEAPDVVLHQQTTAVLARLINRHQQKIVVEEVL